MKNRDMKPTDQWVDRLNERDFRELDELDQERVQRVDDELVLREARLTVRPLMTHSEAPDPSFLHQQERNFCSRMENGLVGEPMELDPEVVAAAQNGSIRRFAPSPLWIRALGWLALCLAGAEIALSGVQVLATGAMFTALLPALALAFGAYLAGAGFGPMFERRTPKPLTDVLEEPQRFSAKSLAMALSGLFLIAAATLWRGASVGFDPVGQLVVLVTLALAVAAAIAVAAHVAAKGERTRCLDAIYTAGLMLAHAHHRRNASLAARGEGFWPAAWRSECARYHHLRDRAQYGGPAGSPRYGVAQTQTHTLPPGDVN